MEEDEALDEAEGVVGVGEVDIDEVGPTEILAWLLGFFIKDKYHVRTEVKEKEDKLGNHKSSCSFKFISVLFTHKCEDL